MVHLRYVLTKAFQWQKYLFNLKDQFFFFWGQPCNSLEDNCSFLNPVRGHDQPLALHVQTSLMNFLYNAGISLPLKTVIGTAQTSQITCGDTGPHLM